MVKNPKKVEPLLLQKWKSGIKVVFLIFFCVFKKVVTIFVFSLRIFFFTSAFLLPRGLAKPERLVFTTPPKFCLYGKFVLLFFFSKFYFFTCKVCLKKSFQRSSLKKKMYFFSPSLFGLGSAIPSYPWFWVNCIDSMNLKLWFNFV